MANRGPFYFFLAGTLSSLVLFIGLTIDTHRQVGALTNADRLDEQVVSGKRAWENNNCNECHTILGFGIYYAPDLTRVYQRLGADSIRDILKDPETAFADSIRKMPNADLSDQEIDDIIAFLEWTGNIDNHDWPPQDSPSKRNQRRLSAGFTVSPGAAAFQQVCMNCHAIGGAGGTLGPALDEAGDKYDPGQIARYARDPRSVDPDSRMQPVEGISDDDLKAIADFLGGDEEGS